MQGDCRFGDRCNFAHGETELRGGGGQDQDGGRGGYGRGRGYGGYGDRGPAPGRGYGGRGVSWVTSSIMKMFSRPIGLYSHDMEMFLDDNWFVFDL